MTLTTEFAVRIYDEDMGLYVEIKPYDDDLFEISSVVGGTAEARLVINKAMANALIIYLQQIINLNNPPVTLNSMIPANFGKLHDGRGPG